MEVFGNVYVNYLTLELHDYLTGACDQANVQPEDGTLHWLAHHPILNQQDGRSCRQAAKSRRRRDFSLASEGHCQRAL